MTHKEHVERVRSDLVERGAINRETPEGYAIWGLLVYLADTADSLQEQVEDRMKHPHLVAGPYSPYDASRRR